MIAQFRAQFYATVSIWFLQNRAVHFIAIVICIEPIAIERSHGVRRYEFGGWFTFFPRIQWWVCGLETFIYQWFHTWRPKRHNGNRWKTTIGLTWPGCTQYFQWCDCETCGGIYTFHTIELDDIEGLLKCGARRTLLPDIGIMQSMYFCLGFILFSHTENQSRFIQSLFLSVFYVSMSLFSFRLFLSFRCFSNTSSFHSNEVPNPTLQFIDILIFHPLPWCKNASGMATIKRSPMKCAPSGNIGHRRNTSQPFNTKIAPLILSHDKRNELFLQI